MIGFGEQPGTERGHPNEDPETRELDKRKLYNMLSQQYFLPPFTTKGITRDYLIRVHRHQVYRVQLFELMHFEVELTTQMKTRIGLPNNSLLVRKLNRLLRSRNLPELGFDDYEPPEENWLYKIARFVDRTNVLQFFESPVMQPEINAHETNPIHRTHYGRLKASRYFHRLPEARTDKKLWDSLHSLSSIYRSYMCQNLLVEKLNSEVEAAIRKRQEFERQLENLVSQAGFAYTAIERPTVRPVAIINNENVAQEDRDQILLNCRL
jgi:hypothetical protein